jgi:hypothetical protein
MYSVVCGSFPTYSAPEDVISVVHNPTNNELDPVNAPVDPKYLSNTCCSKYAPNVPIYSTFLITDKSAVTLPLHLTIALSLDLDTLYPVPSGTT